MAFPSAPGHGNLPQGNWSPVIFSKRALTFFRTAAVAEAITNTDYAGEISDFGDTVRIIKEPLITVQDYKRGTEINIQDLDDEELQLVIDKGRYFAFATDDIETQFSHINWAQLAESSAGYALTDDFDDEILQFIHDNATTSLANLGSAAAPITVGYGAGNTFTPLDVIGRFARLLDDNDVPSEGRWFVANPEFYEQLGREDSKLVDVDITGDPESVIRNRKLATSRMIHGFTLFKTTNNATPATGSSTVMTAGHKSAVATATAITKSEVSRREKTFGDLYKGLLVYGRKVLRPEALLTGFATIGDV